MCFFWASANFFNDMAFEVQVPPQAPNGLKMPFVRKKYKRFWCFFIFFCLIFFYFLFFIFFLFFYFFCLYIFFFFLIFFILFIFFFFFNNIQIFKCTINKILVFDVFSTFDNILEPI